MTSPVIKKEISAQISDESLDPQRENWGNKEEIQAKIRNDGDGGSGNEVADQRLQQNNDQIKEAGCGGIQP